MMPQAESNESSKSDFKEQEESVSFSCFTLFYEKSIKLPFSI